MNEEKLNDNIPESVIIKYLIRDNKALLQEMGKDHAYITELEDLLKIEQSKSAELRKVSKEVGKQIKVEERYKQMTLRIQNLEKKIKDFKKIRDELCYRISNYEKLLKEHNLL